MQYSMDLKSCTLLEAKRTRAFGKLKSKIVIFLRRLQRERGTLVFDDLKVKTIEQQRNSKIAGNIKECNDFCSHDAFCAAFVFCDRAGKKSWCSSPTSKNCLLYSEQQVAAVENDTNSQMRFVWKNYTLVTFSGLQVNRRKRRVVPDERKDV